MIRETSAVAFDLPGVGVEQERSDEELPMSRVTMWVGVFCT